MVIIEYISYNTVKELKESNKVLNDKIDGLKLENKNLNGKMFSLYENLTNANNELLGNILNLEL